ncbi:DNA helicase [Sphaerisporangium krabiense]|uniref:DNA helicase IV n=1 Tax=Sphaerisporangium krabiense TaxID=763782 RepID=A0A7W9DU15_9ACTN|nr:ATP-binding domain-containing protein [Sphaerisporangium krabiense]MBB5631193.1 DNA helicase IV [Sphaerisporangium krabiense]GII61194.1 DNA helicase [Sphaerisporangium krabiense]
MLRARTRAQLDDVLAQGGGGTHQNRSERDSFAGMYAERLARLWAVENGLCFGRLDLAEEKPLYIGRLGISDDDQRRLLIDWRAPVAQPFYRATPAAPMGVTRRRHLQTRGRRVIGVDDDLFDLDRLSDEDRATLNGEAALLASLGEKRTGRMRDIVATIQAEQDRVIRSDLNGVLVVQGGPGTGKTVVALHRAAYLLYTHRERLARRGVLIIGPNLTFLRYIEQVLPSLGETDVLLSTVGELYPGVTASAAEPDAVAAVKGDARMTQVIARAVQDHQRVPRRPLDIDLGRYTLRLDQRTLEAARSRAIRSRRPHNQARSVFVRHILNALAKQAAKALGRGMLEESDLADLREDLRTEPAVKSALNRLWPYLTPQRLLSGLYGSRERMEYAGLAGPERELLFRAPPRGGRDHWTEADVPLLDEAAELLGDIDPQVLRAAALHAEEELAAARRAEEAARDAELTYAREVLELTGMSDILDAERFAARHRDDDVHLTTAERAAADRAWAYGHIIVDEAQELSAMAWRMLMRRSPNRSMTIVGDIAQTGAAAGASSWKQVLDPYVAGRWREETLTVNYRTPVELMAVAADVLTLVGPSLRAPESVRETGARPWSRRIDGRGDHAELGPIITGEIVEGGRLAVIVPAGRAAELGAAITAAVPGAVAGQGADALEAPVAVLTVAQAKGLEFDAVIVVEPAEILAESRRGAGDLYVALTRATQRLGVLHSGDLPAVLSRCAPL